MQSLCLVSAADQPNLPVIIQGHTMPSLHQRSGRLQVCKQTSCKGGWKSSNAKISEPAAQAMPAKYHGMVFHFISFAYSTDKGKGLL